VIDDPAYYQHYRDEVRSSFNYLLAAATIYAAVIGASGFRITEDQFLSAVAIAVAGLIVTSLLNLITLAACRTHFNSKLRRAITGELRSAAVNSDVIEQQNRTDKLALRFARGATLALYVSIVGILVRYFTFNPTATGSPPGWVSLAPTCAAALSVLGAITVTWVYYLDTAWQLYIKERARTVYGWASEWVVARRRTDDEDTEADD